MSKPFDAMELLARVKAHLRRNRMLNGPNYMDIQSELICFSDLIIDLNSHSVSVKGQKVILSPKEFQLLILLAQNPNVVFSIEQLYQSIWGQESYGDYRTVMVHISNMRKKLEQNPKKPTLIQTIKRVGYKFYPL